MKKDSILRAPHVINDLFRFFGSKLKITWISKRLKWKKDNFKKYGPWSYAKPRRWKSSKSEAENIRNLWKTGKDE